MTPKDLADILLTIAIGFTLLTGFTAWWFVKGYSE